MESLIFAINAVLPIVFVVAIGYILKKIGFITQDFARRGNTLVFRVFLPAMLFLNIYEIDNIGDVDLGYSVYATLCVFVVFLANIAPIMAITKSNASRGALLQASFRSNNALIGIPLAQSLCGQMGVAVAAVASALVIPAFNVLSVISLSVFTKDSKKPKVKDIIVNIITNPLIISILIACLILVVRSFFEELGISFRLSNITPIYKTLGYLSDLATPLALLVLGAQFEFSAVGALKKEIIYGTVMRCVLVPVFGIGIAYFFFGDIFNAAHFATFVSIFATPVAVSSVPMAQEMKSDVVLAGQLVVFTTIFSALSVGAASFLLKLVGVFG